MDGWMDGCSDSSHDDPSYTGSSVQHAPALHALLRAKDGAVAVAARLPACAAGRRTVPSLPASCGRQRSSPPSILLARQPRHNLRVSTRLSSQWRQKKKRRTGLI